MQISKIFTNICRTCSESINKKPSGVCFSKLHLLAKDVFEKQTDSVNEKNLITALQAQELIDKYPILKNVLNSDIKSYTVDYISFVKDKIRLYPDLIPKISRNENFPRHFVKSVNKKTQEQFLKTEDDFIKNFLGENPYVKKIKSLLPKESFVVWSQIIPKNCTKSEADEMVKFVFDALKVRQRLDSLRYKDIDNWAVKNKTVIECTTRAIQAGEDFKKVLADTGKGYGGIFKNNEVQRGKFRKSYLMSSPYDENTYREYQVRFDRLAGKERKSPFSDMELTQLMMFDDFSTMLHPQKKFVDAALKHAKDSYDDLMKYVQKKQSGQKLNISELMAAESNIAQIHFIITNSLPFERGTAGIANILTRSLYKAVGIDLTPVKHNVALDLEAFCQPLEKYKQNWSTFFELP